MKDIKIDLKKSGTCKVQLTIEINFTSSKDVDEERVMHSKSENTEFKTFDNLNNVVDELFKSFLLRYQTRLGTSMRGSGFIFDSVLPLYYKCNKINFRRGGSVKDELAEKIIKEFVGVLIVT